MDCATGDGEVDVVEYPGFPEILTELRNLNRVDVHAFTIKCDVTLHASPRRFTTPSRVAYAHTRGCWHQKPRLAVLKHNTFALLHII